MAHGFEKLERLFTGSRRRSRRGKSTTKQQKASSITDRRPSSPVFPSPSYLRPTSTHMTPRDAQIGSPEWGKDRSRSAPTLQEALHKRSSAASSITVVNRPSRSDASVPSLRYGSRDSQVTSRPSRFRFPEDALFKNNKPMRTSEDSGKGGISHSPRGHFTESQGLLDWSPKHISLLFNPLDFEASSNDDPWGPRSDSIQSTLLPAPNIVPSALPIGGHELVSSPALEQTSLLPQDSVQELNLNQIEQFPSSYSTQLSDLDSPASENNEEKRKPAIYRSVSLYTIAPSYLSTAYTAPTTLSAMKTNTNFKGRRNVRETWGNRLDDPQIFTSPPSSDGEGTSYPKLRKSASTSILPNLTSKFSKDPVLKEPTFDDFYALSDDDIAESRPSTPTPLTPANSNHNAHRSSHAYSSQHATPRPSWGENSSASTSSKCQLSYSPTNPRDTMGALWAALLARKYDFAVLYVLSLWPVGDDRYLDVSATTPASPTSIREPKISGRLLAAYGLSEVPSPFEIATDTHLAALECDRWNEYRNIDARPTDIARGWIRPFYSDYTSISVPSEAMGSPPNDRPKDRGIVFAAYSKQSLRPLIPMRASLEQEVLLDQLYTDAKALVDALVKQRPHSL